MPTTMREERGWCGDSCGPCFEHALIEQVEFDVNWLIIQRELCIQNQDSVDFPKGKKKNKRQLDCLEQDSYNSFLCLGQLCHQNDLHICGFSRSGEFLHR